MTGPNPNPKKIQIHRALMSNIHAHAYSSQPRVKNNEKIIRVN